MLSGEDMQVPSSRSVVVELAAEEWDPPGQGAVRLNDGMAGEDAYPLSWKQSGTGRRLRQRPRLVVACR